MIVPNNSWTATRWADSLLELKDVDYSVLQEAKNNWTIDKWIFVLAYIGWDNNWFWFIDIKKYLDSNNNNNE